ncbi:MAG: DUF3987 domain-containing protein [Bacillota bacterium]
MSNAQAPAHSPPASQVADFVAALFEPGDLVEVRAMAGKNDVRQDFIGCAALVDHIQNLIDLNQAGMNIYIGANPRSRPGGTTEDVALARCLFIDLDHIGIEDAIEQIVSSGLPWPPTAIVSSGHGVHAYWRLREPLMDFRLWRAAQKQLIARLSSDPAIHDPPRIMRLPGFVNHKPPEAICEIVYTGGERYTLDQIIGRGKLEQSAPLPTASPATGPANGQEQACAHWLSRAVAQSTSGKRNETGLWLACQLRDAGIAEAQATDTLREYASRVEQPDPAKPYTVEEALATVRSAYSRPAREPAAPATAGGNAGEDPPILPLDDAGDLPEISPTPLPDWAATYAWELSKAKEVSITLPSLLMLPTIASTCQRRYILQIEGSYKEPLCLYTAPSLESGERKTAIHGPIIRPLFEFQRQLQKEARTQAAEADAKRRLAEKAIRELEKEHSQVVALGDKEEEERLEREIVKLTMENPGAAPLPQLVMDDFTVAALGMALAANGESLLVTSDEGGIFDNLMGKFSEVADLDLFLKAHTGSEYTINRTGRDNIFLSRPLLSVAVSPQPGVLAKLGRKDGFAERGLLARFLWALPASRVGHRTLAPAAVDPQVMTTYQRRLTAMADLSHRFRNDEALLLTLDPEAYQEWKAFERSLEPRIGKTGDLLSIRSWASKLPGAVARIAAICHVAGHVGQQPSGQRISSPTIASAIEMGRRLIPHALAAHRLMLGGSRTVAGDVVAHYTAEGWPRKPQGQSEWWRQVRRYVGDSSADFEPVARVLVDHGYLIEIEPPESPRGGRPPRYYRANRRLLELPVRKPPDNPN